MPKPNVAGECILFSTGLLIAASVANPLFAIPAVMSGFAGVLTYWDEEPQEKPVLPLLFLGLKPPVIKIDPVNFSYERKTK